MKKQRIDQDDAPGGLTHNPFAALGGAKPVEREAPAEDTAPTDPAAPGASAARIVVRREKKGRGGKTVTRVAGLEASEQELTELARRMKRALGCGANVDEGCVLLQGALTDRAAKWLRDELGVRVTIGN